METSKKTVIYESKKEEFAIEKENDFEKLKRK